MFPDPLMLVLEDTCTCLGAVPLLDAGKCRVTPLVLLTENRFGFLKLSSLLDNSNIYSLVNLSLVSRASVASRRLCLRLQMQTAAAVAEARSRPRLIEANTVVRSSPSSAERLEPEQTPGLASSSP